MTAVPTLLRTCGRTCALAALVSVVLPVASATRPGSGILAVAAQVQDDAAQQARVRRALEDAVAASPTRSEPYLQLARFEVRMGDLDRAERILRTGLTEAGADPGVHDLRRALVEILSARGEWDAAVQVVELADLGGMSEPGADSTVTMLARLLFNAGLDARERGELSVAVQRLDRATRTSPGLRRAWVELAGLQLSAGRAGEARATAEAGLRHNPGDPELRLIRASTLPARESAPEMVSSLRDLRAVRPDDIRIALSLAGYLAGTGELSSALALQDTLLAAAQPEQAVFRYTATFWLENRQADTARVILERGLALHPEAVDLHTLQGKALELLERPEDAAHAYGRAAALVEEPAWLRLRAASVLVEAGLDEVAQPYLEIFAQEPSPLVAGLLAVETAEETGDTDRAAWILRRLSMDHPGNPWVAEAEARHLALVAGSEAAQDAWMRLAAEGSPTAASALAETPGPQVLGAAVRGGLERLATGEQGVASRNSTGAMDADAMVAGRDLEERWVMERIEADREAVGGLLEEMVFHTDWGPAELARLRDIYPGSSLLARLDTRLALRQGRLERARREVERLLDRQPQNAEIHSLHGEVLEAQAQPDAARRSYGRALEIDAAAPGVFQALTRLHGEAGTMESLLERVRRLRTLSPGDSLRFAQEVELLHRLGRLQEARALADSARAGGGRSPADEGGTP